MIESISMLAVLAKVITPWVKMSSRILGVFLFENIERFLFNQLES